MLDRILVVDDEPIVLEVVADVLAREGFQVSQALDGRSALAVLEREPHGLVLCDLHMPGMGGLELLKEVLRCHPGTDVIIMTGFGTVDGAIDALAQGAADYVTKPLKPREIVARIRAILQRRKLEAEVHSLQSELRSRYDRHNLVAVSPRMMGVASALARISTSEDPVVLYGEPGSGLRFLACAVHYQSPRRDGAFLCVDCDSEAREGVGAAIFGRREDGQRLQRGALERAQDGSLHLRRVEALPHPVQAKLAAALQSRRFAREYDGEEIPLGARLIVSASAPLSELLSDGRLAPELAVLNDCVTITMPPLRLRSQDLPGLVSVFVDQYAVEHGQMLRVAPEAIDLLRGQDFPGNVRQLFAVLRHAATLSPDGTLRREALERSLRQSSLATTAASAPIAHHLEDWEHQLVLRAVHRHPGRLDEAARELGLSRTTLWRRMRKYGIRGE
jgi:DNA-binding NtrC family response regulator